MRYRIAYIGASDAYDFYITDAAAKLQELVDELISDGYRPKGGVSVTMSDGKVIFVQAMIKKG